MAIVEEVSDEEDVQIPTRQTTPIRQSATNGVPHHNLNPTPARPAPPSDAPSFSSRSPYTTQKLPTSLTALKATLRVISQRLALPEDLFADYVNDKAHDVLLAYRSDVLACVKDIKRIASTEGTGWGNMTVPEHAEVYDLLGRVYTDEWPEIRSEIDSIPINLETISIHLLSHSIRPLFAPSPHPSLHPTTTRALSTPHGGPSALSDMHDDSSQRWKLHPGWGVHHLLYFSTSHLSPESLVQHIGLVLPPTLTLMDDWEPAWRGRGARVLDSWIWNIDVGVVRRMRVDEVLIKSLMTSLGLHGERQVGVRGLMRVTMRLIWRVTEAAGLQGCGHVSKGLGKEKVKISPMQKRAEMVAQAVETGIIQGWVYAPYGEMARIVNVQIAQDLQVVCEFIGQGVVRWLKMIIPYLLQPLSFTPTPHSAPHILANLDALLVVMRAIRPTGRMARWRGHVVDGVSRLWVMVVEKERDEEMREGGEVEGWIGEMKGRVREVMRELNEQFTLENECERLIKLDKGIFEPLVQSIKA